MTLIVCIIYNLTLLIGTAYLVGWQGWNPWWFLVTLCCLGTIKSNIL